MWHEGAAMAVGRSRVDDKAEAMRQIGLKKSDRKKKRAHTYPNGGDS